MSAFGPEEIINCTRFAATRIDVPLTNQQQADTRREASPGLSISRSHLHQPSAVEPAPLPPHREQQSRWVRDADRLTFLVLGPRSVLNVLCQILINCIEQPAAALLPQPVPGRRATDAGMKRLGLSLACLSGCYPRPLSLVWVFADGMRWTGPPSHLANFI